MINRHQLAEEVKLRKFIREAMQVVHKRKQKRQLSEEKELRSLVKKLIAETKIADPEDAPHKSTGINVLKDLLKKIIRNLEIDFKQLTTSAEQRTSYRTHILHAVQNTLAPSKAIDHAGTEAKELSEAEEPDITIDIDSDDDTPEEFIDVRGKEKDKEPSPEAKEKEAFGVEGEDETGRDKAYKTFVRIEKDILDAWEVLYAEEDKELFYDYLITLSLIHI